MAKILKTNTKQKIWDAYQEALKQLDDSLSTPKTVKTIKNVNLKLSSNLNEISNQVTELLQTNISTLSQNLDKATQVLEEIQTKQISQEELLKKQKQSFIEEQKSQAKEAEKQRTREQEEYVYEFSKKKNRQESELAEKKSVLEKDFSNREATLKEQEDELNSLRTTVANFQKKLEQEIKIAIDETTKKLKQTFEHEQTLTNQKADSEIKLQQQTSASLKTTISNQEKELKRLQTEVTSANKQLTNIAEQAVRQPKNSYVSQGKNRENSSQES